ncbi:DUF6252 family protein [uncultured Flavobacterium sp.]|jgi:hypothetical protein|uniref:DUF6252 family protein n=1 Tax=uncultured Flavobacterium sp. TaxID=165435 RepID=UPI002591E232|nr:DUF6252 family protein [uncultured Flavobacterium sp.]
MKTIKSILTLLVLTLAFTTISCDDEPVDPVLSGGGSGSGGGGNNGGGSGSSFFRANFDGQTWNASTTQAIVNSDYISINGMHSNGSFFQITIPNGAVGTYNWAGATSITSLGLIYSSGSGQVPYLSLSNTDATTQGFTGYTDTAELVITEINTSTHKITGTFKFTGVRYDSTLTQTETKVFTSGQFSVPYTSNNTSPSNNTFTCKLDGNNFVTTNVDGIKNSGLISLIGRRGSVENISLSLVENIAVGTHNLDNMPTGTNNVGMYVPDMSGNAYSSNPGTVTITTHNIASKRIVGTFQFTGASFLDSSTHSITNGSFDITYQ